jgi:hypothetical protein
MRLAKPRSHDNASSTSLTGTWVSHHASQPLQAKHRMQAPRDSVRPSTPGPLRGPYARGERAASRSPSRPAAPPPHPRPRSPRSSAAAPLLRVATSSPPPAPVAQRRFLVGRSRGNDLHTRLRLGLHLVSSPDPLAPRQRSTTLLRSAGPRPGAPQNHCAVRETSSSIPTSTPTPTPTSTPTPTPTPTPTSISISTPMSTSISTLTPRGERVRSGTPPHPDP